VILQAKPKIAELASQSMALFLIPISGLPANLSHQSGLLGFSEIPLILGLSPLNGFFQGLGPTLVIFYKIVLQAFSITLLHNA